jgi:hypothetical protein
MKMTPLRDRALAVSDWLTIAMAIQPHVCERVRKSLNKLILENMRRYFQYASEAKLEELEKFNEVADALSDADVALLRRLEREIRASGKLQD